MRVNRLVIEGELHKAQSFRHYLTLHPPMTGGINPLHDGTQLMVYGTRDDHPSATPVWHHYPLMNVISYFISERAK